MFLQEYLSWQDTPAKHQITIGGTDVVNYGNPKLATPNLILHRIISITLKLLSYDLGMHLLLFDQGVSFELILLSDIAPDSSLTVEPRPDFAKASQMWPSPQITEGDSDKNPDL